MAARPVIIDCDPGQDDAVNLLLAIASPEDIAIEAVTTVAGNVPLALTTRNARIVCDIGGRTDIPVHAGCARPMVRDLVTAEQVHGPTGLDGIEIFEPATPLAPGHAVDILIERLLAAGPEGLTLVPTGPLTNIAMAMVKEPAILPHIREIVLMGGAMREGGNFSPSAEFNILVDPHAAHVVFRSGRPIIVAGLDVTHRLLATPERLARLRASNGRVSRAVHDMVGYFNRHDVAKYGFAGAPLHDPATIAWLLAPSLFAGRDCHIAIEHGSELTMGHMAVDFWHVTGKPANARWLHEVDADGFFDLLIDRLERLDRSG